MRKDIVLPALALLGGGAGFLLRWQQLSVAFDQETMLMRSGTSETRTLVLVLVVLAAAFGVLIRGGRPKRSYARAFYCPSAGYMALTTAAAFLLLAAAGLGLMELIGDTESGTTALQAVTAVMCVLGGGAALLLGKGNYRGDLDPHHPILATLPAYMALPWLVLLYQQDSREPELMLFVFQILAVVCVVLALYAGASFAFERPQPKMCLFFSMMGIVLLLTSLADRPSRSCMAMDLGCALLLLGQSYALLRSTFGPRWPKRIEKTAERREPEITQAPETVKVPETAETPEVTEEDPGGNALS